jgi:hypothetical protein
MVFPSGYFPVAWDGMPCFGSIGFGSIGFEKPGFGQY